MVQPPTEHSSRRRKERKIWRNIRLFFTTIFISFFLKTNFLEILLDIIRWCIHNFEIRMSNKNNEKLSSIKHVMDSFDLITIYYLTRFSNNQEKLSMSKWPNFKRCFLVCPIDASCKTLEKYECIKLLYEGNKYNKCENGQMLLLRYIILYSPYWILISCSNKNRKSLLNKLCTELNVVNWQQ